MKSLHIDVSTLLPALLPIAGIVLVLVADLVMPRLRRAPYAIAGLAALAAAVAAVPGLAQESAAPRATVCIPSHPDGAWASPVAPLPDLAGVPGTCFWQADALASTLQVAAAVAALVCIALAWPSARRRRSVDHTSEPVEAVLLLTALAGAITVASSRDVGTWLIALELATLPVIVLVALSGGRGAVAGATQLLVTSLVSFALLVLGVALWFAGTGSPFFTADAALSGDGLTYPPPDASVVAAPFGSQAVTVLAVVVILAGLAFKLSLVPFHAWTPTAYVGATTPVATFLATVSKIAALAALLVVLRAVTALGTPALVAIAILAALSMTLGNLMALRQDNVIRLLAWSTVAQAGWVILPLVSVSPLGTKSAAIYLLTYVVATLVAFAVVALTIRERPADGRSIRGYSGLWRAHPWRAGALALALTSLAGLPPGIIGLVGKVVALRPVLAEGWVWLTIIAAANAVLGVAVYLRWLRPVVTEDAPEGDVAGADGAAPASSSRAVVGTGPGHRLAIITGLVLAAAILVIVSVQPDALLRLLG